MADVSAVINTAYSLSISSVKVFVVSVAAGRLTAGVMGSVSAGASVSGGVGCGCRSPNEITSAAWGGAGTS